MTTHATRKKRIAHGDTSERDPSVVPESSKTALREAMRLEKVPNTQFQDLLWIMAQESSGKVDARNSHSTARGLFQLLRNNYEFNPNGADSFGTDVEECQGGIRYIHQRYHSAQRHHWY